MAEPHPSSFAGPLSPRAKKRQRQRVNQQNRTQALAVLHEHPSYENALSAWLAFVRSTAPSEHPSASKFARCLTAFCVRTRAHPEYTDEERISADQLVQWVEELAWALNIKATLSEDPGAKTSTGYIGANFRSFINFLSRQSIVGQDDVTYLSDACRGLEDDLARTTRANRVIEEYINHIQTYFDAGHTVDESFLGEYEVMRVVSPKVLALRKYVSDEDEEPEDEELSNECYLTQFPRSLVEVVKVGDIMAMQICHIEHSKVWVPYMYSGFTPTRDDGTETPRGSHSSGRLKPSRSAPESGSLRSLQGELAKMKISARSFRRQGWSQDHDSGSENQEDLPIKGFNESHFTEQYFSSWEGDIDSDEDVDELLRGERALWQITDER